MLIEELVVRIVQALRDVDPEFEIILVDDDSPDKSWARIESICAENKRVKGLRLSRNFGQHYAISAGLTEARGDIIVVMDCDLQDRPEAIPALVDELRESGHDYVIARRTDRQDSLLKRLGSRVFYRALSFLTNLQLSGDSANFGAYRRSVISAALQSNEKIRFFPAMIRWAGFRGSFLDVQHAPRNAGQTNYDLRRLIRLGGEVILSYSDRPLKMVLGFGLLIIGLALTYTATIIFQYFKGDIEVPGFSSLFASVWLVGGLVVTVLGAIGLYVGKIFESVKGRPVFIVKSRLNLDASAKRETP